MKLEAVENEFALFDVEEHEDHYLIAVDLPGFPCPDMEIQIDRGKVQVNRSSVPDEEKEPSSRVLFRSRSSLSHVRAVYDQGVLWITLPKQAGLPSLKNLGELRDLLLPKGASSSLTLVPKCQ